jgi:hypothetical protein
MNNRKVIVKGKMGLVISTYNYTYDVYMFRTRKMLTGVSKRYTRLLPKEVKKGDPNQLSLL